jgi:hypothetical protein
LACPRLAGDEDRIGGAATPAQVKPTAKGKNEVRLGIDTGRPRSMWKDRSPPNCDVQGRDPQRMLYVDSGRLLRANTIIRRDVANGSI